jgi:TRAP-type uncharacterized transport system substrate-binding protein
VAKSRRIVVWLAAYGVRIAMVILLVAVGGAVLGSLPTTHVTIEAGTKGGLFDAMVESLSADLKPYGVTVDIVNRADSKNIIEDIVNKKSPVDAGFVASEIPEQYNNVVRQAGTVMFSPVYLVAGANTDIHSIGDIAGHRISLYPKDSAAWSVCEYVLQRYGVTLSDDSSSYGNGLKVLDNVATGVTEAGCLLDVPAGSSIGYASDSMKKLADVRLRYLEISEAQAIEVDEDFLIASHITAGTFEVFPTVKPAHDLQTNAALVTFVAKENLPRELVTLIAQSFRNEYSHGTAVSAAGELPSAQLSTIPAFDGAADVFQNGLPWLYRNAPFPIAAFLDRFLSTYGLFLTTVFLVLAVTDNLGLVKPWHLVRRSRQPRMRLIAQNIAERLAKNGVLSRSDQRKLAAVERWIKSQNQGLEEVETLVRQVTSRTAAKPKPTTASKPKPASSTKRAPRT